MAQRFTALAGATALLLFACNSGPSGKQQSHSSTPVQALEFYSEKAPPGKAISDQRQLKLVPPEVVKDKAVSAASDSVGEFNTEDYDPIVENAFLSAVQQPLSTFSIDVDEAAYSNVRRYLTNGTLPPPGAVRIEEMINYFDYDYPQPSGDDPFSITTEMAPCPWNEQHRLIHIGLQGKVIPTDDLPPSNLVFLVDVSGSMDEPNKLPLVQSSLKLLTDQLRPIDKVAMVVYAGNAGLVLPSTPGNQKEKIRDAIDQLQAGGSTAGGAGIELAYKIAADNFIRGGNNRVILTTDGDFNVGASSDDELVQMIEQKRKTGIYLSVLGYGMGNYKDNKMQQLADKGNGNHAYIDNISEARKVLVNEFGSTLFTIAKDVKIQVEFNPEKVEAYRLVGYENRMLAAEDFNDDRKDAGDLGSGHRVTALYEVIPAGVKDSFIRNVDPLKYQLKRSPSSTSGEVMTIKLRYKKPDEDISRLTMQSIQDESGPVSTSDNFRFAAAVAEFGLLLRRSDYIQNGNYAQVIQLARSAKGADQNGYRSEFINIVASAVSLAKK
jgi:Ca-activated chloride channel family protein